MTKLSLKTNNPNPNFEKNLSHGPSSTKGSKPMEELEKKKTKIVKANFNVLKLYET